LIVEKSTFGFGLESIISLSISIVVSFILIALYNVQDYIENPFDQKGLDDLKISEMDVSSYESLSK
jgi:hypothetical protein